MSNKITKKSYCIKRLRDCGYHVDKIDSIEYAESDYRKWSAIIDPGGMSILLTCNRDDTIHLYDGGQYINSNLRINTDSVEVIIQFLNDRGLIHKYRTYGQINKKEED